MFSYRLILWTAFSNLFHFSSEYKVHTDNLELNVFLNF